MKRKLILFSGFLFLFGRILAQSVVATPFKSVNSKLNEMAPVLSPDGKALYFTVAKHPQNIGGEKDPATSGCRSGLAAHGLHQNTAERQSTTRSTMPWRALAPMARNCFCWGIMARTETPPLRRESQFHVK